MNPVRSLRSSLVPIALLLTVVTGCGVRLHPAKPDHAEDVRAMMQQVDVLPPFPMPEPGSGSLWVDGGRGDRLFLDARAGSINDLLTIRLDENSLGANESTTDLNRSSQANVGASTAFGLEKANPLAGSFNLNQVLGSDADTQFAGDGSTTRASRLTGTLTTRVMRVLPNGDLVIAGQKTVTVNRERNVITLVGSVRRADISASNIVASSRVGNLTMRMWGQGEIDSTIRQGWFMKVLNAVWPF